MKSSTLSVIIVALLAGVTSSSNAKGKTEVNGENSSSCSFIPSDEPSLASNINEEVEEEEEEDEDEDEDEGYNGPTDREWSPPDFATNEEETEYYGPRDRFWRHSANTKTLHLNGVDYYPSIEGCMNDQLTPDEWLQIRRPQNLDRRVGQRLLDADGEGPVILVEIKNAMSPIHAKAVQVLNQCVRKHISFLYEKRPMYQVYAVDESSPDEVKEQMGGNNPTHLNSIVAIFLPHLVEEQYRTLAMAYHAAGWQAIVVRDDIMNKHRANDDGTQAAFANYSDAGMRACEYLTYEGFNNLMQHQDGYATSVVLNVMLSAADEYQGGAFYIRDKIFDDLHHIRPDKYSALAFLGGTHDHGVDTIYSGKREALSTEWWYYPDLPFGVNLCAAEFRNIEEHIRQCNEVQLNVETRSYDYDIPCHLEFPSQSIYGVCHSHMGTVKEINLYADKEEKE